jgi:hypothetical protein
MDYFYICVAQFFSVFALVMGSKLLRDDRWVLAMCNSWLISITQFVFVFIAANSSTPYITFFFAAIGGSCGCGFGHLFYTRFILKGDDS